MKKSVNSILTLVCICAAVAILMAITNSFTAPIIEKNESSKSNEALLQVLPEGGSFEQIDLSSYTLPETVTEAYKASNGGYVIKLTTSGYSTGLVIMCGVNAEGKVTGTKSISNNETPNIGGAAINQMAGAFKDKGSDEVDSIDTVAGATRTTAAYRDAIKDALNAAIILGGGSVDLRDEAQILADNLAAALPAGDGAFTKLFIVEEITGIDAIYAADNGRGYVCVIGDKFIGANAEGKVEATDASVVDTETAALVESQLAIILASVVEDVDVSAFEGLPSALICVKKTATGNYIVDIKGSGYGINGGNEWHPASGEYIYIRVSVTADGKIIDCLTVSQAESTGIGDACADEKFYGQFDGKTESDYKDIDAISGATLTTDGYLKAIERVFTVVNIIEGGAANE